MAKIQFGVALADARGKFAGSVFSSSRTGAYLRRKSSPVQPRSNAVTQIRSAFTALSKAWSNVLTNNQRAGFRSLAAAHPVTNVFGNSIILTGLQLYQQLNRNLGTAGVARIDDAPVTLTVGAPGIVVPTIVATNIVLTPTVDASAGEEVIIEAAPPINGGRLFVGSSFRVLAKAAGAGTPYTLTNAVYAAKFGTLVAGQHLNFRVSYINKTTGAKSAGSTSSIAFA